MPPFLPRKRSTPPASPQPVRTKRARLADALDAEATNNIPSLKNAPTFSLGSDDSSSDSSLSDVDSEQFEDVTISEQAKKQREKSKSQEQSSEDSEDDDDEDNIEWEDAAATMSAGSAMPHVPMANGPIQITLRKDDDDVIDYGTAAKAGSGKKGPSKREKQARITTHQLHVQFLLLHNAIRNKWIEDKKLQDILVKQLPPQILKEVDKWKRSSGLHVPETPKTAQGKGKKKRMTKETHKRSQRDWGQPSQRLEPGKPDMSHGDPLISLMKFLSAYWRKRFAVTAPGLRKRGYGTKHGLKQDIASWRNDEHDPERHGERIEDLAAFMRIARKGEGSRDVGAQLFTALLRGLGIEARLVASLQPSGFGWTKVEQMVPRRPAMPQFDEDSSEDDNEQLVTSRKKSVSDKVNSGTSTKSGRGKPSVIDLDTDVESAGQNGEDQLSITDDDSIIDITPSMPKQRKPRYDRDLVFPVYWTEAISPITNKVLPVSPLVLENSVAATAETLSAFEPRGARAEKGRQVMAYVVAHSSDGSAKDVTVRYLRKSIWPGKTKGFRLPVEKIPIYDARGKVKRYEDFDWFKYALSPYTRSDKKRTAVDDVEDSTDLVPQQPEKKNEDEGVDTLQSLKSSADFVLERFLRREEALRPGAKAVRMFASGKGDKYKQEPVYRRADVERCLTAESWHKEGRRPKLGETPMKMVPVRAVTLTRKREAEEYERQYGEKQTQGLYAWDQTEWIIPPPIEDGVIPKNAYGNMDCFVPSMVPDGAVHIPWKGTVRVCKKLDIDFAEAVTGFEFGNKRAVPVCTGVVVAKENEKVVKDAWHEWNEEQRRKEETKLEKLTLDLWRKFVLGLRIRERVQDMYGEEIGIIQDAPTGYTREDVIAVEDDDEALPGGFMNENEEEMGGGFLLPHEEEAAPMEDLIMDDHHARPRPAKTVDKQYPTPLSVSPQNKSRAKRSKLSLRTSVTDESELSDADSEKSDSVREDEHDEEDMKLLKASVNSIPQTISSKVQTNNKSRSKSIKADPTTNDGSDHETANSDPSPTTSSISQVNSSSTGDTDDLNEEDESVQEETHTPRSTRTRAAKPTLVAKSTQDSATPKGRLSGKRGQGLKTDGRPKSGPQSKAVIEETDDTITDSNDVDDDDDNTDAKPSSRSKSSARGRGGRSRSKGAGRGRGRPRVSESAADTKIGRKRSTRLLRKESTIVTSPYFKPDEDVDD